MNMRINKRVLSRCMVSRGLGVYDLANAANVSYGTLYRALHGNRSHSSTIHVIANALGMNPEELVDEDDETL